MNSILKDKLELVIRVINEHGYKVKFIKHNQSPEKARKTISVSTFKLGDVHMYELHKLGEDGKEFICMGLSENERITERDITLFLGVRNECAICYTITEATIIATCESCKALICEECSKRIDQCPICQDDMDDNFLCNMVKQNVNEVYQNSVDEYRDVYEQFTAAGSDESLDKRIDRYSKFLSFWHIKLHTMQNYMHDECETSGFNFLTYINKKGFVCQNIERMEDEIDAIFIKSVSGKIREKAYKFLDSHKENF